MAIERPLIVIRDSSPHSSMNTRTFLEIIYLRSITLLCPLATRKYSSSAQLSEDNQDECTLAVMMYRESLERVLLMGDEQ